MPSNGCSSENQSVCGALSQIRTTLLIAGTVVGSAWVVSRLRSRPRCSICRSFISGQLDEIKLSILCSGCSLQRPETQKKDGLYPHSIKRGEAIVLSRCLPKDLSRVNYSVHGEPSPSPRSRWYLRGEVWYLKNLRRKENLEQEMKCRLKDLSPRLRFFLLGDYLKELGASGKELKDILLYKDVIHRANEIVRHCPSAHPQAVLDYCLRIPYTTMTEFSAMKEKVTKVFQLEGRRILHYLTADERRNLKDGPLGDVCRTFKAVKWEPLVVNYLKRWFHPDAVSAIMADESWRNCDWATGSEDRVAVKLKAFWEEKVRRTAALKTALSEKRLPMPESCIHCEAYLNGGNDLRLKELVACIDLRLRLEKMGVDEAGALSASAFGALLHSIGVLNRGHYDSVRSAIERAQLEY